MDAYTIACGLIAAVAIPFAWASRDRDALAASAILWGVWLNYALSWTPYGFAKFWQARGFDIHSIDLWSLLDCFNCFALFLIWRYQRKWWSGVLTVLIGIGCYLYVMKQFYAMQPTAFYYSMDALFLAEEAVFFALGGGPLVRLLVHWIGRGGVSGALCPARQKALLGGTGG